MKKFLIITLLTMAFPLTALANHQIDIKVNGMVCDFCAQSVWKVFEDYEAVDKVDIDLDTGMVIVHLKENQNVTDEQLNKAIQYAGYDLVDVTRHKGHE